MIIDGINAIAEALRSGVVSEIWIRRDAGRRVDQVVERARREKIPVHSLDLQEIEIILGRQVHQGVAADVLDTQPDTLEDLCRNLSDNPLLLGLDGIEDPMNFGAIARSAEAVGVDALIFQTRRSAQVNAVSNKASAGGASIFIELCRKARDFGSTTSHGQGGITIPGENYPWG